METRTIAMKRKENRKNQCITLYILHLSRPPTTLMIRFLVEIPLNYYSDYYSTF